MRYAVVKDRSTKRKVYFPCPNGGDPVLTEPCATAQAAIDKAAELEAKQRADVMSIVMEAK